MGESVGGEENVSQKREEIQRIILRKRDRKKKSWDKIKIGKTEKENTLN